MVMASSVLEYRSKTTCGGIFDESSSSHNDFSSMQKFRLYATRSNFYMIGKNKDRTLWKVLKIDRLDPLELNLCEDYTRYNESECSDLLRRIDEGNKATGGLKFVTSCYGIVGFIKFLGPHYMLIVTKRRQIGVICGHKVYAVCKTELIPLSNASVFSYPHNTKTETRFRKLLCMVDLSKDFFFSYSYNIMRSLQKNAVGNETGQTLYEAMFVWNEFLTRDIRNHLQNTVWTVALVHGFFEQKSLSINGKNMLLTLIARRSRHYAGTRYLKRGVNEMGKVANDVETEQILYEDVPDRFPVEISSVVQHRGSIPLFWSQETSGLNIKPDIVLSNKDLKYKATRLHFENLVKRYGKPVIVLNLIKSQEKKPRESNLRTEFANAIDVINKGLTEKNRLKFLHWDLHKHSRSNATSTLSFLGRIADYALGLTGFFYCHASAALKPLELTNLDVEDDNVAKGGINSKDDLNIQSNEGYDPSDGCHYAKPTMFQRGVLRTNCVDCLDRTNVAQYAYGLAALGHQLQTIRILDDPKIDLGSSLANELMDFYERMGDNLAHQYGGSAAHNKIFSQRRGQWKAATQSQEFFRTLQRHYNNAYTDGEKQASIDVFLGHLNPHHDNFNWESDSSQIINVEEIEELKNELSSSALPCQLPQSKKDLSDFSPYLRTCEPEIPSLTTATPGNLLSEDIQKANSRLCDNISLSETGDLQSFSNFVDIDWLSSSGNSCEEETFERSSLHSLTTKLSSDKCFNEITKDCEDTLQELNMEPSAYALEDFADGFVQWVSHGEALCL